MIVKKGLLLLGVMCFFLLSGCKSEKTENVIQFATSAEYPPFEFHKDNQLVGFDIELAQMLAEKLHKKAEFKNMQFSTILPALENGSVDAAISTITITPERKQNFDFSQSYYEESLSMIYQKTAPIVDKTQLNQKKIACQLGSTMEIWLKKYASNAQIILMNNNNEAVEALKSGHVDAVLIDTVQAVAFASKNPDLAHSMIAKSDEGYGIAFKKGSTLKNQIDQALQVLKDNGDLEQLKKKWLENATWQN
jgi:polar amino acid transport system substrate-binding protein